MFWQKYIQNRIISTKNFIENHQFSLTILWEKSNFVWDFFQVSKYYIAIQDFWFFSQRRSKL